MIHIIKLRPLGYCPARNVSTMLVHQVHVISRFITATDIVSFILAITEIRSAFHQTMSSTLYQLGHAFIDVSLHKLVGGSADTRKHIARILNWCNSCKIWSWRVHWSSQRRGMLTSEVYLCQDVLGRHSLGSNLREHPLRGLEHVARVLGDEGCVVVEREPSGRVPGAGQLVLGQAPVVIFAHGLQDLARAPVLRRAVRLVRVDLNV